ncbi:hypothetical protein GCM10018779_35320 [Streptomyces griseocarneus]|nr:hypothetical protein GCM10018779_35320 [Streptomyces griseocarneus]
MRCRLEPSIWRGRWSGWGLIGEEEALGRDAKRVKQARRDKRKRAAGDSAGVPPFPEAEIE